MNRFLILPILILLNTACQKDHFSFSEQADDFFFLRNEGADMPIWVKGNTASNNFIVFLHGGPGGSAFLVDEFFEAFTDELEANYGMVYWEQRAAGTTQGNYNASKLTPAQFVEDLEKLILLLKDKYRQPINIVLMGISWGGYLGNSYLIKSDNQNQIKAWINIVGPNDFLQIANSGRRKLLEYAALEIDRYWNAEEWKAIKNWCEQIDTIVYVEDFIQENKFANQADLLMRDSLIMEIDPASFNQQLAASLFSPFNPNMWQSNRKAIDRSELIEKILATPVSCEKIQIPSLLIGGKFDFVVPEDNLQLQYEQISTPEKELHILKRSGHAIIGHETNRLLTIIKAFLTKYG